MTTPSLPSAAEAKKLNLLTFAMVDTNSNPKNIDFPIPSNDDASKSIDKIMEVICNAIKEGLNERKGDKDKGAAEAQKAKSAEKKEEVPAAG